MVLWGPAGHFEKRSTRPESQNDHRGGVRTNRETHGPNEICSICGNGVQPRAIFPAVEYGPCTTERGGTARDKFLYFSLQGSRHPELLARLSQFNGRRAGADKLRFKPPYRADQGFLLGFSFLRKF